MDISSLNYVLALGTLALQIAAGALLVLFLLRKKEGFSEQVMVIAKWGIPAALFLILVTAGANFYYESFGSEPCPLCWWQRIFLYPQAVLFAFALWRSEYVRAAVDFSLALSVMGAGVALYQHALQMLPGSGLPCPAVGASCSTRIVFELGYITYPLMAFSLFAFLIVVMLVVRNSRRNPLS